MKKIIAVLLGAALSVGCLAGCGKAQETAGQATEGQQVATDSVQDGSGGTDAAVGEARLVGVAVNEGSAGDDKLKDYLNNEVGPALNLTFDFSEVIADNEALIAFIENERSKGAVGIINQLTNGSEQATALCDEYGMFMVNWESSMKDTIKDLAHNMGSIGGSVEGIAMAYGDAISEIISDGEDHSIILFTGAASYGAQSHVNSARAALEAFQKQYNLTYEKDIMELAATSEVGEIETGNDKIKIYMVPGTDVGAAASTVSTQLQTGNYDMFMAVFSYEAFTSYISEVEAALDIDVKIVATTTISEATMTGFTTMDTHGNQVLNAAILDPTIENAGFAALLIYLGLEDKADSVKVDGQAHQYFVNQWFCTDADTYNKVLELDTAEGKYVISGEELLELADTITVESLEAKLLELRDLDQIISKAFGQ